MALVAAKREKRRADEANAVAVISILDFEKAQDDLRNAELAYAHAVADADLFDERLAFELRASELSLQSGQLLVDELQRQIDALTVVSPVNGIVGDLLVDQKAAVSRDTPVMAVVDLSRFEIEAQVPESYADDLGLGMQAEILLGTERFAGELVAVSPEILNNQVASRVRFVGDMPRNIRQNQRLTTRILIEERPDVLMLQRGQFLESGAGRIAYVLDGDEIAVRKPIEIGARSLGAVEVISGLAEGERVVVSSVEQFSWCRNRAHYELTRGYQVMLKMQNISMVYRTENGRDTCTQGIFVCMLTKENSYRLRGPSGSGKTTFLNIAGLLEGFTSGTYLLDGNDTATLGDAARSRLRNEKIGFIFQSFNLIPELDIFDNVDVPLRYRGFNRAERKRRIEQVLDRVGLASRRKHLPSQLSGGQQQRVAIARALAGEPRFLLADEPTGNLDTAMAESVMQLLESINANGTTIIMVTHEPNLAARASRNIFVRDGRVSHGEQDLQVAVGE